jgi:murein DD-endopeptidase MepM/ murein hydrolase activator NlpD
MKTIKLILTTVCTFLLTMPIHAQFNTIGTTNSKRIKTINPSKSNETLTDSISLPDSVLETGKSEGKEKESMEEGGSIVTLPLKNIHIGSGFGMRMHPIYHKRIMHNGIDLSARYENVYSMFPGTVVRVGQDGRSGKYVTVRTGNYTISYCHLSQQLVKESDFIVAGTTIAVSGNTGASTGPHLHITAKKDGKAFNAAILIEYINKSKSKSAF